MTDEPLPPERMLALAYAPRDRRDALAALWELDARMRRVFVLGRAPALVEIKLAWWQERLMEPAADAARGEPLLERLERIGAPEQLAAIPDGWRELPGAEAWPTSTIDAHAALRGRALIGIAGLILGVAPDDRMLLAGEGAALADLVTIAPAESREQVLSAARLRLTQSARVIWPRALRPAGMLVALAARDVRRPSEQRHGSPARVARMAWHSLTGR